LTILHLNEVQGWTNLNLCSKLIGMLELRRSQIYLNRAKRLFETAKVAQTVIARRELEELAVHYEALAEYVALLERFPERRP
jgi:hypothetical protein